MARRKECRMCGMGEKLNAAGICERCERDQRKAARRQIVRRLEDRWYSDESLDIALCVLSGLGYALTTQGDEAGGRLMNEAKIRMETFKNSGRWPEDRTSDWPKVTS